MATKPTIASPAFEWINSTPQVADGAQIDPWVDTKPGGGLNATAGQGVVRMGLIGGANQWSDEENGIIFDDLDGPVDTMAFATPGTMLDSDITIFAVVETTDMSAGCCILGTSDGINPPTGIYLVIYPDGSIHFIIGKNGALAARDIGGGSAPGLFVDGTRAIVTARLDVPSGGATLRVNRVEVASFSGIDLGSPFWFSPKIGQANLPDQASPFFPGAVVGKLRNMPWIAAYASAASDGEIAQMEGFLFEKFIREITVWTDFPEVMDVGGDKPIIANSEIEYDARTLSLSDGDPVVTWPDQSGNANNAVTNTPNTRPTFREDRWGSGVPSVEFLDTGSSPDNDEELRYDATPWELTDLTIFVVAQVIDISEGAAFVGNASGATPPRECGVGVLADGSVFFGFGTEIIPTNVETNIFSPPGTVEEGDRIIITARHTDGAAGVDPEGMMLRVNGELVASVPTFIKDVVPTIQQGSIGFTQKTGAGPGFRGKDRLIAWIGGYSVAASDEEILAMESFLFGRFGFSFKTPWTDLPAVSPGTSWAATTP